VTSSILSNRLLSGTVFAGGANRLAAGVNRMQGRSLSDLDNVTVRIANVSSESRRTWVLAP